MSETLLIWLFGILGAWCSINSAALLKVIIDGAQLRSIMILTSKKAAEILHSPDNHHGLDEILDRYIEHEDLPIEDWLRLKQVVDNPALKKEERLLCLLISAFADHKLKRPRWANNQ